MKPNSVEDKGFRRKLKLSIVERHIGKQNEEINYGHKKFLWFLKDEFKGKLTRTDNDSEMYFHATLPKAEKKRYRTEKEYLIRYATEKMAG